MGSFDLATRVLAEKKRNGPASAHAPSLFPFPSLAQSLATQVLPRNPASIPTHPGAQRRPGIPLQRKLAVGSTADPLEAEADRMADRVMSFSKPDRQASPSPHGAGALQRATGGAAPVTPLQAPPIVDEVLRSSGQPLDTATRSFMEPRFGRDLSQVRVHTDHQAAESASAVDAQAYTLGSHIVFQGGQYAPSSAPGKRLLAHELTHTLQQSGDVLRRQPTSLGAYPEAERRSLRQSTIPTPMVDDAFLLTVFGTAAQNGGATTTFNFAGTTVFDPAIAAPLQRGLGSVGAYLSTQTNVLPLGSTVTLHLDLTPYHGTNGSFRFSRLTHTENKNSVEVLLIENVGAAPAAIAPATLAAVVTPPAGAAPVAPAPSPATPAPVAPTAIAPTAATAGAAVPSGPFSVGGQNFIVGPSWMPAQFGSLQAVLARLPAAVLTEAAGTTFSLRGQGTPDEAGHYDAEHDEIVMHQNAFPATNTTFGGADGAMLSITHEIGHLFDLRRQERAWRTFNTGGQTAAGRRTLLANRSLSGERWTLPPGGSFTQAEARTAVAGQAFRTAAQQDGIHPGRTNVAPLTGAPTAYGNTDWQELFAESFALFINDPALFQLIRPHLFQYFTTRFATPAQPASAAPAAGAAHP